MDNIQLKQEIAHQKACNDIRKLSIAVLEANVELLEGRCRKLEQARVKPNMGRN